MILIENIDALIHGRYTLSEEMLRKLSEPPLSCIQKEFPHYVGSISSESEFVRPKKIHPAFYGCYDWHSSVHSYWSLIRQLRVCGDHPLREKITTKIDEHCTQEKIQKEVTYFEQHKTFEKPYGWAWFLRLVSELHLWDNECAERWMEALQPLEELLLELIRESFLNEKRPMRVGTHGNNAFALLHFLDYARVRSREELENQLIEKSKEYFLEERDAPVAYEPFGWDFLSPSLVEADLMRRVLSPERYVEWLDEFFPDPHSLASTILHPMNVELDELMAFHLVGLNLSRAWSLRGIAADLPQDHRYTDLFLKSARDHAGAGLEQTFSEDYGGSHWLTSFAVYLLTEDPHASSYV